MRALPVFLVALVLGPSGALAHPLEQHRGDPAELRWRALDGAIYRARLDDATRLTSSCLGRGPITVSGAPTEIDVVVNGKVEGRLRGYRSRETVLFLAVRGDLVAPGRWCRAEPEVLAAMDGAKRMPAPRGPWLAFIALCGGIAVAVGLVAMWGAGRGGSGGEPPFHE